MKQTFIFLFFLFLSSCAELDYRTEYQKTGIYPYPRELNVPVALFLKERNGLVLRSTLASGYLVNKEEGIFCTARHFADKYDYEKDIKGNPYKIFYHGRVYTGKFYSRGNYRVPPTADYFFVKTFEKIAPDSSNPYPLAENYELKRGEPVLVLGIHPHPFNFLKGVYVLSILQEYYGVTRKIGSEFVLEILKGEISEPEVYTSSGKIKNYGEFSDTIHINFEIKMEKDHEFSFAGLSGGPIINKDGELVGMVSTGWEFEKVAKGVYVESYIRINSVHPRDLLPYLSDK